MAPPTAAAVKVQPPAAPEQAKTQPREFSLWKQVRSGVLGQGRTAAMRAGDRGGRHRRGLARRRRRCRQQRGSRRASLPALLGLPIATHAGFCLRMCRHAPRMAARRPRRRCKRWCASLVLTATRSCRVGWGWVQWVEGIHTGGKLICLWAACGCCMAIRMPVEQAHPSSVPPACLLCSALPRRRDRL